MIDVHIPAAFKRLSEKARIKCFYGGRGAGKSESVGRYLLLVGKEEKQNILCCREFQVSIKQSVHSLLEALIQEMHMESFYRVTDSEITGINGTKFVFAGLKNNIANIKSMHEIKRCWVEEAQVLSENSINVLLPTIRAEDSEIIFTMNPILPTDPAYVRFVLNPPRDSVVVKVNYDQNPFFPSVLEKERLDLLARDPIAYKNVWLGEPRGAVEGAIYEKELREAEEQGRITDVPYDPKFPVSTFFDLGWGNHTSIWFVQQTIGGFRVIDCYENSMQKAQHYIQTLKDRGYVYNRIYLPHDAEHEHVESERTMRQIMESAFPNVDVRVLDNFSGAVKVGIEASRAIFPLCLFDRAKCADGLQALRHYHYKIDPDSGKVSREPEHDWSSDFADSWRYVAMAMEEPTVQRKKRLLHPSTFLHSDGYAS